MEDIKPTLNPVTPAAPEQFEQGTSLWKDAWHRLKRNRLAVFGGIILIVLTILCFVGPFFTKYKYYEQDLNLGATPPSSEHLLGTDKLGRDQFVRVLIGGQVSIMVGLCATFVSLTIGLLWGAVAGFKGGKTDMIMMRIVDIMYSLPFTVFVILLMVLFKDLEVKFQWL